jgi:hypothetical protein
MKKSIYDLAYETVHENGAPLTENYEKIANQVCCFRCRGVVACTCGEKASFVGAFGLLLCVACKKPRR